MPNDGGGISEEIEELVREGEIGLALERLKTASHGRAQRLYDDVVLAETRHNRLRREHRRGVLRREDYDVDLNILSGIVLDLGKQAAREVAANERALETTRLRADTTRLETLATQQIIGINNLKQISWLQAGLRASRSVCRILTPNGFGTGFLVAPNVLMTNNHVIPSADVAAKSQAEFDYQQDESGGFSPAVRYDLEATEFHTSAALDYSLARIRAAAEKPPLSQWGTLRLNPNADPTPSEHVVVIQHPNGGYKQIVLTANWVMSSDASVLHYTTDTMPGSSGSPVFNDSWHVVAIHHAGGQLHKDAHGDVRYVNEGVLMSAIRTDAAARWPQ